jgi:hypothetical protein
MKTARTLFTTMVVVAATAACSEHPTKTEPLTTPSALFDGSSPPPDTTGGMRGGSYGSGH